MARFSAGDDEILIEEVQKYECIFNYEEKNYKNFVIKDNAWEKVAFSVGKDVDECKARWKSIKDTYLRNKKKLKLGTGSASSDKPIKWKLYERLRFLDKIKQERTSKNTLEEIPQSQLETATEDVATDESTFEDPYITENSQSSTRESSSVHTPKPTSPVPENDTLSSSSRCSTPLSNPKGKKSGPKISRETFYRGFEERAQKRMELLEDIQQKKRRSQLEENDVDFFMKSIALTVKKFPTPLINEAKLKILTVVNQLQEKTMHSFSPHSSFHTTSTEAYPHHSSYYNNAPITGHGSDINTTTSISRNPQVTASAIQPHTSPLYTSLNTFSRQLPSNTILFGTSFKPNDSPPFFQPYQVNQPTSSQSHQPNDENIDPNANASYQQ